MSAPNIVIPSGKLYIRLEDANGDLTGGELYLAETPGATLNVTPNSVEVFSADTSNEELIVDATTRIDRRFNFSMRNINDKALELYTVGAASTVNQSASPVTAEALGALSKGAFYQLGTSATNPTGIRGCTSVTIKLAGSAITLGTDYKLDAALGRIQILETTSLAEGGALTADYTPSANSRTRVAAGGIQPAFAALRFIADNTAGANRDVYIPRAHLLPTGDLSLKARGEAQSVGFAVKIMLRTLTDGTVLKALYIDGRP